MVDGGDGGRWRRPRRLGLASPSARPREEPPGPYAWGSRARGKGRGWVGLPARVGFQMATRLGPGRSPPREACLGKRPGTAASKRGLGVVDAPLAFLILCYLLSL